jgi:hypothetical protein
VLEYCLLNVAFLKYMYLLQLQLLQAMLTGYDALITPPEGMPEEVLTKDGSPFANVYV